MEKEIKLNLKVNSKDGENAIKRMSSQLKKLETASSGKVLSKGTSAASRDMKKLADEAAKAAEEYRKIADANRVASEKYQAVAKAEKQRIASINKDHSEAVRINKRMNTEMEKQVGIIGRIKKQLFDLRSYWLAISAAVSIAAITVVKFFKAGFSAVEKFRLSVASIAASITTFSDLSAGNVDEVYANAVKYASQLALKMEIINARTIASGEQLRAMNETFVQQGVLLDVNSKKQEDAFVAVANAISLITQGQNQEIQMRQEIRGLLSGDIRATNLLAKMINAKLGGSLKKNIKLWKQQGTLLENLASHLEGFKAGSADLASTWAALSTTFETIGNRYLRGVFKPIYGDIIEMSLDFSRNLLYQKDETEDITTETGSLYKAWYGIKTTTSLVLSTIENMKGPTASLTGFLGKSVEGLITLIIAADILMGRLSAVMGEGIFGAKLLAQYIKNTVNLDFSKEAAAGLVKLSAEFEEAGIKSAGKFAVGFFDEWKVKYHEMMGTLKDIKVDEGWDKPELSGAKTDEAGEAAYYKTLNTLDREYQREKIKLATEGYEQRRALLRKELAFFVADNKESFDLIEAATKVFHVKMAQINIEQAKEIQDSIEKINLDTQRNLLKLEYDGYKEKRKLFELELANFKGTADEKVAYTELINSQIALSNQSLVNKVSESLQGLEKEGNISENIKKLIKPLEKFFDKEYKISIDIDFSGITEDELISFEAVSKAVDEVGKGLKEVEEGMTALDKEWEAVTENMQESFSSILYDTMKGELDSFGDYFESFMSRLQKTNADYLAKMLADWVANLAKQKALASQASASTTSTTQSTTSTNDTGTNTAGGGGWGIVASVLYGTYQKYQQKQDDREAAEQAEEDRWKQIEADKLAALLAIEKTLVKSMGLLDAQLEATHQWSLDISAAKASYDETTKDIWGDEGVGYTNMELDQIATVRYFKEISLIVDAIQESLLSFEESITNLTATTYQTKMDSITSFYDELKLAIDDIIDEQKDLETKIAEYELSYSFIPSNWYERTTEERLEEEVLSEAIADLKEQQVNYSELMSDWEGSYSDSIEAAEEYFAEMRKIIVEDVEEYVRQLVGPISGMEDALSSVTSKFENWIETIEDLGAETSELLIIQENWLEAIQAAADAAIFDLFIDVLEDLSLLKAQVAGTSEPDYYLEKHQEALSGNEWVEASEYLLEWYNAQTESVTLWSKVVDKTEALITNIQDVINSIKYGKLNVALPTEKAEMATQDYEMLKAAALVGGEDEVKEFINFSSQYLQSSQDALKSSEAYQNVYDSTMEDLLELQGRIEAGDYDQRIYEELEDINEELNNNLLAVGVSLEERIDALRDVFEANFDPSDYASFAEGGISTGPMSGYMAQLHGREAVIPLDNGNIPVNIVEDQPINVSVFIGNEQLDTHIVKQIDGVRVKTNRRSNISTQRLF